MKRIYLTEGHPRGFCSNLICLLGALRKYPDSEIILSPPFMSLYDPYGCNGYFHFFESRNRIRIPTLSDPPVPREYLTDFGTVFPFPSYEDNMASNGELQKEVLDELSIIFSREIRLKAKTKSAIKAKLHTGQNDYQHCSLAIHRRATDHSMHTRILSQNEFLERVKDYISLHQNIFVATDELGFIELCKNEFKEKIIYSNDVERASGHVGVHFRPSNQSLRIQRGIDVLTDILSLAKADDLLCGASGIPIISQIINPSLNKIDIVKEAWS